MASRAVSPRGGLWLERRSDANEVETDLEAGEADILGRISSSGVSRESFASVDGLKAGLEGDQIPFGAMGADHPESSLRAVEGEPPADRLGLEDRIPSEILATIEAGAIQRGPLSEE